VPVAAVAAVALRVFLCQTAVPGAVDAFWAAPAPPVCSCRVAEPLTYLAVASLQAGEAPEQFAVAVCEAWPALVTWPQEAAPQAAEIALSVLQVVGLRAVAAVCRLHRAAAGLLVRWATGAAAIVSQVRRAERVTSPSSVRSAARVACHPRRTAA
jgi:hypothetical protein